MKIVLIGANGTIGTKINEALAGQGHEILKVGRKSGDFQADIADENSLKALFQKIGKVDAIVNASGEIAFAPVKSLTREHWLTGFNSKFMGQVNLIQVGSDYLNPGGSITLITGVLSHNYIKGGATATAFGRALEGFVQAASAEIGNNIRINVVSPGMLLESKDVYGPFFPGFAGVEGSKVARAYVRSIFGIETGKIFEVNAD